MGAYSPKGWAWDAAEVCGICGCSLQAPLWRNQMKHFNLKIMKIDLYDRLLAESKRQQIDVNALINIYIERGLGEDEKITSAYRLHSRPDGEKGINECA